MLEIVMAIKNNNVKKIPNYDPTHQAHLQKISKTFLRPGKNELLRIYEQLNNISFLVYSFTLFWRLLDCNK